MATSKLSDVVAMVVDNDLFTEIAVTLAPSFKKMYYFNQAALRAFPRINGAKIGDGMEGIEVVDSLWHDFENVDLYIFPDIHSGPTQDRLLAMGKLVWGCRGAEEIEVNRIATKKLMAKWGLNVGPYEVVMGITALRDRLKQHKVTYYSSNDVMWIKIDGMHRGHFETIRCDGYDRIEGRLNRLQCDLGPYAELTRFVIEADLPNRVELGMDAYCIDGQYPKRHLYGIERPMGAYIGMVAGRDQMTPAVTAFSDAAAPTFKSYGYRGFFSDETRVDKKGRGITIDPCTREGSPPGEGYIEFYTNLPEIIYAGAQGTLVEPDCAGKWMVLISLHSDQAVQDYLRIDFPKAYRQFIKLRYCARIDGKYWRIPQETGGTLLGRAIGWGDSMAAAEAMAKEIALSVRADEIDARTEALPDAEQAIELAREYTGAFK